MKKTDKKPWETPDLSLDLVKNGTSDFLLVSGEEADEGDWDTLGFNLLT